MICRELKLVRQNSDMPAYHQSKMKLFLLSELFLAGVLLLLGRHWWCSCHGYFLWSGEIFSAHNSQHLLDPYSFSHIQHGILFYFFLWLARKRGTLSIHTAFAIALLIEIVWEGLENSPLIIDRYRAVTVSLGYYGDSIINSMADLACCATGFLLCCRFSARTMALFFVLVEISMLCLYRDSLLVNVLMLTFPIEAIRIWQSG